MPKFIITTLGSKVNQAESETIARDLTTCRWSAVGEDETADICIVNTCTVTQRASMQSRQAVRQAIRANPNARIVVTGCYAQTEAEVLRKIKGVHEVIGHAEKHRIARRLAASSQCESQGPESQSNIDTRKFACPPPVDPTEGHRTRPFLKIQDGCDAFCTYCIVPYARGRSRSISLKSVLEQIKQLADNGYHEVVLTGIHIGNYGKDLEPRTSLLDLLKRIHTQQPIARIRLSSIEPLELSPEIIKCVATSEVLCPHFHIPLQSADISILKKMHRPYTPEYFKDLVLHIRRTLPQAAIGVDVLIGFPGETQAAFNNTYRLIAELPVSYLHVFPFSPRPGTPASTFNNKVSIEVIKKRCQKMRALGSEKRMQFYRQFIGQQTQVLIESSRDSKTGLLKGTAANYLQVLIRADDEMKNKIVAVEIKKIHDHRLYAKICSQT
ncbi:MAG: tRNA (N(6)-L-threonylcarbamoyladenosine(37)-C(2))-methylthiotransferase MtaB [Desulfobacterales bacterium]|nr:MAG: tRNA (N(6)-L-threonylcarbamoyladenosine(37)-C(2))-methylthiotransferase MtaB [Desulfobacterales bacterium]